LADSQASRGWAATPDAELIEHRPIAAPDEDDPIDVARTRALVNERLFGVEAQPTRVGRFVLLEVIGAGAMGRVYAAYDPELDRKIALKLIRTTSPSGMGKRRARLLREAKAMARLAHPNVVAVYDAGAVEDEVFIAMEYVRGQTLREWMRAKTRGWAEVLAPFLEAGRGLVAAHAAGVVHRDFKPENVLVGEDGRVRVLDFGLARAADDAAAASELEITDPNVAGIVDPDALADSKLTRTGAVLGTPAYMSPEQFEGKEATPTSDQFAFCVSLWEGLYGERPFAGSDMQSLLENMVDGRFHESESERRTVVPVWLRQALERGLAFDPAARHADMDALLRELDRAPSRGRRGAWAAIAVGAIGAGALGLASAAGQPDGLCEGGVDRVAEVWNETRAERASAAFSATGLSFAVPAWADARGRLDAWADAWASAYRETCEATHVRKVASAQLLDRKMVCLERQRAQLDATVDTLEAADAEVVVRAGTLTRALPDVETCSDVARLELDRPMPPDGATAAEAERVRTDLAGATARLHAGKYGEGHEEATAATVAARSLAWAPLEAEALGVRGRLEAALGEATTAHETLLDAVALAEANRHDMLVADLWLELAAVATAQLKHVDRSRMYVARAEAAIARVSDPPRAVATLSRRRAALARLDADLETAAREQVAALELLERELGEDDPELVEVILELGELRRAQGRHDDAALHVARALRMASALYGEEHPRVAAVLAARAKLEVTKGEYDAALEDDARAHSLLDQALGPDHPRVASVVSSLGRVHYAQGEYDEAHRYQVQALEAYERSRGARHPDVVEVLRELGAVETRRGNWDAARGHLERALEVQEQTLGLDHPNAAQVYGVLGILAKSERKPELALDYNVRALRIRERSLGPDHTHIGYDCNNIGDSLRALGRLDDAAHYLERARDIMSDRLGPEHVHVGFPLSNLGRAYLQLDRPEDALVELERAYAIRTANKTHPDAVATTQFDLARALGALGRDEARARELMLASYEHFSSRGDVHAEILPKIEGWLREHGGVP
jgi:tetratricopeptide (TPR) repeat protein/predicted Ser/Thr protein kinase